MLSRLVRIQLAVFTIASVVGLSALAVSYLQAPMLLGLNRIAVTLELPDAGGLYRFANVTYRGVQIGKVTAVDVTPEHVVHATLSLDDSPQIPVDLEARVRSVSAVGEQFVDLWPRTQAGPFLHDGSVIPMRAASMPQAVGPMLDQVSALIGSIPKDKLSSLLDESFKAVNGAGYDMGSLLDSASTIAAAAKGVADRTGRLVDDSVPLLDSQVSGSNALRTWTHSLAGITRQVADDDAQVRSILDKGPGALDQTSRLLQQIRPTLPILLANLTTVGKLAVTYNPSLEQVLVLLPPSVSASVSSGLARNDPTGYAHGEFTIGLADPVGCTVGYLPPSAWRSPADTTDLDTPDGLYCKLPQDSPIAVRGARNYPCMAHPGKRAPTVEICDSDQPYQPLAMRQHVLGPSPIDPNLLRQGIAPDDRTTSSDQLYAPVAGTPMPPGSAAPDLSQPQAAELPVPPDGTGGGARPPVAEIPYSPDTGGYVGPDGRMYNQSDLAPAPPKTWQDMLPK